MSRIVGIGLTVMFLGLAVATGPRLIAAQEGTPPPSAAGVQKEVLGQGQSAVAPDRVLLLQRRTFAPGSDSGAHPAPGPVVLYVDSGAVVFAVKDGAATVTRAGSTKSETIAAGSEATLQTGDSVSYDQGVVHDVRNDGADQAVTLEARLNPTQTAAATPTP
jgi:quercetin dioxygenase-like cupin family protein